MSKTWLALQRNLSSSKENGMRTHGSNKGSRIARIQEGFLAGGVDLGLQMIFHGEIGGGKGAPGKETV